MFLDPVPRALRALDPVDDSAVHHQPRDSRARQRADPLPVVQVSEGLIDNGTVDTSASKISIRRFVITEKAHTRAFSWLKAATTAFTIKTLLRHNAKWTLTPRTVSSSAEHGIMCNKIPSPDTLNVDMGDFV